MVLVAGWRREGKEDVQWMLLFCGDFVFSFVGFSLVENECEWG